MIWHIHNDIFQVHRTLFMQFGFVENRTFPVKAESSQTKSLADLMQDVWILCMNFVTSPCHDVSPKGKDSSVGESPPTLRWPYFKESGCW